QRCVLGSAGAEFVAGPGLRDRDPRGAEAGRQPPAVGGLGRPGLSVEVAPPDLARLDVRPKGWAYGCLLEICVAHWIQSGGTRTRLRRSRAMSVTFCQPTRDTSGEASRLAIQPWGMLMNPTTMRVFGCTC